MNKLADISMFESLMNGSAASGNMSFNPVMNISLMSIPKKVLGLFGKANEQDNQESPDNVETLTAMAESGDVDAQLNLGHLYKYGSFEDGVAKDLKKSAEWFRRAAEQGDCDGQRYLGWAYAKGKGVPQSNIEAEKWLNLAGDRDDLAARHAEYLRTLMKAEKDPDSLTTDEMNDLGYMYYNEDLLEEDLGKAKMWFTKAAEKGDTDVSPYYLDFIDSVQDALEQEQRDAEHGNAQSQYELGLRYLWGEQVEQDYRKAFEWLKQAADQGHAAAQVTVAACYYFGKGVNKNQKEANAWAQFALKQGQEEIIRGRLIAEEKLARSHP